MSSMTRGRLCAWVCSVWLAVLALFVTAANADDSVRLVSQRVQPGDTIRALLVRFNCVTSMTQYGALREEFRRANPAILHSGHLALHEHVRVPSSTKEQRGACLSDALLRVVRVECENLGSQESVRMYVDGPILPEVFLLKHEPPQRVVCDFEGALPHGDLPREIACPGRLIRSIRVGHEDKPFARARVVVEIDESLAGHIEQALFEQQSLFVLTVHELPAP